MSLSYDELLENDIRRARAKQPPELRERVCRICGPFMLSSCPAAPKHDLRPVEGARMKKTAPKPAPQPPMSLDDMTREIAAGLRDVINETDSDALKKDFEETFIDLACRLVFRLQVANLTIVPSNTAERIRIGRAEAATRIFNILTHWMLKNPECSFITKISATGKFQVVVKTPKETRLFFGETVQDAYAQAAQTLSFDEGAP
jgi:hypothetical protein